MALGDIIAYTNLDIEETDLYGKRGYIKDGGLYIQERDIDYLYWTTFDASSNWHRTLGCPISGYFNECNGPNASGNGGYTVYMTNGYTFISGLACSFSYLFRWPGEPPSQYAPDKWSTPYSSDDVCLNVGASGTDIVEYNDYLICADSYCNALWVFDLDCNLIAKESFSFGTSSSDVNLPGGLALINDILFIADINGGRITSRRLYASELGITFDPGPLLIDLSSFGRVCGIGALNNQVYAITLDLSTNTSYLHVFALDLATYNVTAKILEKDISSYCCASSNHWDYSNSIVVLNDRGAPNNGYKGYYNSNPLYVTESNIYLIGYVYSWGGLGVLILENVFDPFALLDVPYTITSGTNNVIEDISLILESTTCGISQNIPIEITAEGWGQLNTADLYFDDFSIDAFCGIFAFDEEITSELTAGCNYVNQPFQFSLTSGVDVLSSSFTFELEGTIQPAVFHEIDLVLNPFMEIVASTPYKAYAYSVEIGIPDIVISGGIDTVGTGVITISEPTIEVFTGIGIEVQSPLVQTNISVVPVPTITTNIDVEAPYLYSSAVLHPVSHAEIFIPKPSTSASFSFAKAARSSITIPTPVIDGVIQTPPDVHVSLNISTPQVTGALIIIPSLSVIVEPSIYIEARGLARDIRIADYLYLVNQRLGATTQLSIPDLKSLVVHEGYIYYSTPTGIYRIATSDTQDSIGEAFFITGDIDINIPSIKNYLYVFITGRINSGTLTIYTDDGSSYDYDIAAMPYRAGERRAVLGRGLRSRYLRFKITSSEPFEIERIRVVAEPSRRVR